MNAARRLFLEQGVGATTIEQITSRANVAKGTFYLYFESKEDVLAALGDRFGDELLVNIKAAVEAKDANDWNGKLSAWASTAVSAYLDAMRLHDILFYGLRPPSREGLVDNVIIDHLRDLLEEGARAGAWRIEDPRFTAIFLFSGLHGVVDDAFTKQKRVNRTRLAHNLEELCFRAAGLAS